MRINNNIMALNSHRNYTINAGRFGRTVEQLSSGFRVNRAADDAAGLAISEKMRTQIRGLRMASRNAQDGISLLQTAEGALQSSHEILQRMRELTLQAASDINDYTRVGDPLADRGMIQAEIEQLAQELVDIGLRTEFNGNQILTGTAGGGAGAVGATAPVNPFDSATQSVLHAAWDMGRQALASYVSDVNDAQADVATKAATLAAAEDALERGTANAQNLRDALTKVQALVQGLTDMPAGDLPTKQAVIADLNAILLGATAAVTGPAAGAALTPVAAATGDGTLAELIAFATTAQTTITAALGAQDAQLVTGAAPGGLVAAVATARDNLVDEQIALADAIMDLEEALDSLSARSEFNDAVASGDAPDVTQLEALGFTRAQWEAAFMSGARAEVNYTIAGTSAGAAQGAGGFQIQVGANARQLINIDLPDLIGSLVDTGIINTPTTLDANTVINWSDTLRASAINVDINNVKDISNFVENFDHAIAQVSEARAILGAQQNRMEFKIANLDNTAENLQAAESRIRDTDMAAAMTTFTRNNIMFQASTAMLAQANALPQAVLQLLG